MDRNDLILVLKAQQWERCKGELKSLTAIAGSAETDSAYLDNWKKLCYRVNEFIEGIESEGWQE